MVVPKQGASVAKFLQSANLYALQEAGSLDANTNHHAYNALDSAVTLRVHEALQPLLAKSPHATASYALVRAMQGPALDMMLYGVAIQRKVRLDETERYLQIKEKAQSLLDTLADAVWGPEEYIEKTKTQELYAPMGKRGVALSPRWRTVVQEHTCYRPRGLNAGSSKQVLAFFNIALNFPVEYEIRKTPRGHERTPSANDKALRKWAKIRTRGPGVNVREANVPPVTLAAPLVSLILTIRDADKMLQVCKAPLDPDGRMRCSYNVCGAETGRWSSSSNAFGRGTNIQNITPSMRRMFCCDDGHVMVSVDEEQAESRVTGALVWAATGDDTYWRACESADLHTTVCRMAWPELGWTDDPKANRAIAETLYPGLPRFTYRDVAKRFGHGSNYEGSAFGIAQAVGVPVRIVEDFQRRYFSAFPCLSAYHKLVRAQLKQHQYLDTPEPLERRRWFFGRPWDDATAREAIAHGSQSSVAEHLNIIMHKAWLRSKLPDTSPDHLPIRLLLQNHDSFTLQTPLHTDLPNLIRSLNDLFLATPLHITHEDTTRPLIIPGEFKTGFNWANRDEPGRPPLFPDGNPDGLVKWYGADGRKRQQAARTAPSDWLDAPVRYG